MAHIGKGGLGAYQRLYDPCLSAPVWMRNVWRIAASWNAAIFDLLGYAPEESIGQSLATIVPDRLKERHRSVIATYIKAGERHLDWNSIVLPGLHKEGSEIQMRFTFGQFFRTGNRVFTEFIRRLGTSQV